LWKSDEVAMSVEFNHTIVWSRDSRASASFLARMLGLPDAKKWGPFQVVTTANGVNVDFMDKEGEIRMQHYAFLVSEPEFDQIFGRLKEQGLTHWADPARTKAGEINHHDGGRGVYFQDPSGHLLEVITRAYGSSGWEP
jgi:catechol 2,3-dioxygenase-like lactoylglutathione lyase family enzyme